MSNKGTFEFRPRSGKNNAGLTPTKLKGQKTDCLGGRRGVSRVNTFSDTRIGLAYTRFRSIGLEIFPKKACSI